jgi:hypothetical protein
MFLYIAGGLFCGTLGDLCVPGGFKTFDLVRI